MTPDAQQGCRRTGGGSLPPAVQSGTAALGNGLTAITELNRHFTSDPIILLPGLSFAWMFIVTPFITTPNWEQLNCPLTAEWINKWRPSPTMGYYSAMKKGINYWYISWLNLKDIRLIGKGQSRNAACYVILLLYSWKDKAIVTNGPVVARTGVPCKEFFGVKEWFCVLTVVEVTRTVLKFIKLYMKWGNFLLIIKMHVNNF